MQGDTLYLQLAFLLTRGLQVGFDSGQTVDFFAAECARDCNQCNVFFVSGASYLFVNETAVQKNAHFEIIDPRIISFLTLTVYVFLSSLLWNLRASKGLIYSCN